MRGYAAQIPTIPAMPMMPGINSVSHHTIAAGDQFNRQRIRENYHPAHHIAHRNKKRRADQCAPDSISLEHRRQTGDEQAGVGDGAYHHNARCNQYKFYTTA